MPLAKEKIGYLYVNGLGYGTVTLKDALVHWWWARAGKEIGHARVNWYDGESLQEKEREVRKAADDMFKVFDGVVLIGGSAGGSLALNVFPGLKRRKICVVTAHARLAAGDYRDTDWMSLFRRAKMDTKHPSRAFYDSVTKAETLTIPNLTNADRARMLNLTQLTDMVVDTSLMQIEGVATHRSIAFGHSGGFLAHLLADRDLIVRFAERNLN